MTRSIMDACVRCSRSCGRWTTWRARRARGLAATEPELAAELASLLDHAEAPRSELEQDALEVAGAVGARDLVDSAIHAAHSRAKACRSASGATAFCAAWVAAEWGGLRGRAGSARRTVALKMLRRDAVSPTLVDRFRQEAEILGRLQHPGIAQIYDAGAGAG